jgi:hypothetical protein
MFIVGMADGRFNDLVRLNDEDRSAGTLIVSSD